MSVFAIYAFVITGLYIVYMSVVICLDLFGKKGQEKDGSEEIVTDGIVDGEDESTLVSEVDGGYSVSRTDESSDDMSSSSESGPTVADDGHDEPESAVDRGTSVETDESAQDGFVPDDSDNPNPMTDEDIIGMESGDLASDEEYERILAVQDQLEEVVPNYQDDYPSEDFALVMAQPISHKSRVLRKYVNKDDKSQGV